MKEYNILNKIVLFIAQDYIQRTVDDNHQIPPLLYRLKASVEGYKKFHMFSPAEAKEVLVIAKSEAIDNIMNKEVSYTVFVMELMKLWTQGVPREHRPHLNISDKHFKLGGRIFWKAMLNLKTVDTDSYKHKQSVIDDSIIVANEFFKYHYNLFIKDEDEIRVPT